MLSTIEPLSRYISSKSKVKIFDWIFCLHTKCTFIILILFTILLSAKQYFGDPIHCISNGEYKHDLEYAKVYCWTMGTYILKLVNSSNLFNKSMVDIGVGQEEKGQTERFYLRYYQWVVIFLMIEAIVFYMPRYLWKYWEDGRLNQLADGMGNYFLMFILYVKITFWFYLS